MLLYGCESWTLTAALTKRLDGLYTRLLRFALNITWRDKWTNDKLYQGLRPAQDIREAKREKDEVGWSPYKAPRRSST